MEAGVLPEGWHADAIRSARLWAGAPASGFDSELPAGRSSPRAGRRLDAPRCQQPAERPQPALAADDGEQAGDSLRHRQQRLLGDQRPGRPVVRRILPRPDRDGGPAMGGRPRGVGLVFSLESADGSRVCARATIPEVAGRGESTPWACTPTPRSQVRLVITPIEPTTMWLDVVSLFPRKTFKNRPNGMRADVAQMLADLKPDSCVSLAAASSRASPSTTASAGRTPSATSPSARATSICGLLQHLRPGLP